MQKGSPRSLLRGERRSSETDLAVGCFSSRLRGSGACDDELAICDDRDRWRKKKEAEFYNQKYNELIWDGLGTEDDDD